MQQIKTDFGYIEPVATIRREIATWHRQQHDIEPDSGQCASCQPAREAAALHELYAQFFGDSEIFNLNGRVQLARQSAAPRPHHVWSVQHSPEAEPVKSRSSDELAAEIESYGRAMLLLLQAMLRHLAGDDPGAQHALSNVKNICDELTGDQAAGTESPAVRVQDSGLTPREIEVLQVVAEGCTDTEVGDRLYISPRTVSQHLCSIYNKLDVRSRGLAIRYAVESGLV